MSNSSTPAIPEAFLRLHRILRERVKGQATQKGRLRILPQRAAQLAQFAEARPEFLQAIPDLFGLGSPQDYLSQDIWENHVKFAARIVPRLLQRSGFYHGVISNKPPQPYYKAIIEQIAPAYRPGTTLYLLDGCRFPKARFRVAGHLVARLSANELETIGLPLEVCDDFFPEERIDSSQLSDYWFVNIPSRVYNFYNWDLDGDAPPAPKGDAEFVEVAAGHYSSGPATAPVLPDYMKAVLGLSLYNDCFFEIPVVLSCEPGWRRFKIQSRSPRKNSDYEVDKARWAGFSKWLKLYDRGLGKARDVRPVLTAARRYLQATFATGDIFAEWVPDEDLNEYQMDAQSLFSLVATDRTDVYEDALLYYVLALEALLTGDSKTAISEKLAIVCALLVGRDDHEAIFVRKLTKDAYDGRSSLVHGQTPKKKVDIRKLRLLCQRALVIVIGYFAEEKAPDLDGLIRGLPISQALQRRVKGIQTKIFGDLAHDRSLSE
jgi:hypothetical protein